jgi:hypothetical protein
MDPGAILSVTATCAKIAKTAWNVGKALYTFTKDPKIMNKTLNSLIEQSRAVRDPCELLAVFLKGDGQDVNAHPAWATTCHGKQLGNTLKVLQRQLDSCEATLESLCKSTEGICSTDTASANKAWATPSSTCARRPCGSIARSFPSILLHWRPVYTSSAGHFHLI